MNSLSVIKNPHHRGICLLVLTTILWASSFSLQKYVINYLSPAVILSVRFAVAAIALAPWLRHLNRSLLRDGGLLGSLYFSEVAIALTALETISASRAAFIISLNVILVPLFGAILGRRVPLKIAIAAGLAVLGIGIMSWEGGGFSLGDLLTLGCAMGGAVYILLLEKITPRHPPLPLVATQLMTMALLGCLWAVPQLIDEFETMTHYFSSLVYLGLMVTATPVWTQALAQRWMPAYEAALIYTLEPVFATLFSFWFLGETLGIRGLLGAGLVLSATILSQSPKKLIQLWRRS